VLIVTSLDEEPMAMRLGAAAYLRKPVNRSQLLQSVEHVLSRENRYVRFKPGDDKSPARPSPVAVAP
jgi:DNA-binding NtrC family response regulator